MMTISEFPIRRIAIGLLLASMLSACTIGSYDDAVEAFNNNNGGPPPTGSPPPDPPTEPPTEPPPGANFGPNFSEIQTNVFDINCTSSSCHAGANPAANLNLEAQNSHTMVVGMFSGQDDTLQLVNPFNADDSYLIRKLEGAPGIGGGRMPPGGALPQVDIDVIRQWITEGAVDDRAQASTAITVASVSPLPGAMLAAAPRQIVVGFDRQPDAATINSLTFSLETSRGVAITAPVLVPAFNPRSAVMDLRDTALADDTYTIRLRAVGSSVILDEDAHRLNDGHAEGDVIAEFTIATPAD